MKVLQLGKFYPIQGGVEKVMLDLLDGVSNKGICCDMLCANAMVGKATQVIEYNKFSKIYCANAFGKRFATMLSWQMVKILRQINSDYDIIHVHHPDPMAAFALLLSGYKGKVVLHWRSDILKQRLLLKFFMPLQNWLIKRSDMIVGTTPVYVAQSPHLRKAQKKCTYLPIGIEPITYDENQVLPLKNKYEGKKINSPNDEYSNVTFTKFVKNGVVKDSLDLALQDLYPWSGDSFVNRSESGMGEIINIDDPSHIVAITRKLNILLPYKDGKSDWTYIVSAIGRTGNESPITKRSVEL